MIAVSDTSPLCYLILIDEADLLLRLFGRVVVPRAVFDELVHEDAPKAVRDWAAHLPSWAAVHEDPPRPASPMAKLHEGEQSAILLAEALKAEIVVLDEKAARRVAAERGLRVTGTLGVLGEAATRGLIDLPNAIEALSGTNFRCAPALLKAMLERFGRK